MNSSNTVTALYTPSDLRADQLDHSEWNRARAVSLNRYWSGAVAPSSRYAEAKALWSKEALLVLFNCRQNEPLIISSNPEMNRKTIGLWDRDVCEIFIAPRVNEPNRYFEFEVAPTGEWVDLAIDNKPGGRETDLDFDSGMTAGARIANDQIVIGMRIPWGELIAKPEKGVRWRVNLFRCIGSGKERGYLAWQPTHTEDPNFHVPTAFGWMVFE